MSDIPEEAVDALARTLYDYEDTDDDEIAWEEYRPDAKDMLRILAPLLAAQVRRETAEQIAEAITGSICGPAEACANRTCSDCARYMQAQEDAIIARQIGGDHAS